MASATMEDLTDFTGDTSAGSEQAAQHFTAQLGNLGHGGAYPHNYERDFVRLAQAELNVRFDLYQCPTLVKHPQKAVVDRKIPLLLPFDLAHLLWEQS